MSYILGKNNTPFLATKLTDKGREKLAKGQLNYAYWAVGDSEINYGYEEIKDDNDTISLNGNSMLLKPKDKNNNIKYFVTKDNSTTLNTLSQTDINLLKVLVSNLADERGFFNSSKQNIIESPYTKTSGTVSSANLNGTNVLTLDQGLDQGDLILLKLTNSTLGNQTVNENSVPIINVWYKVVSVSSMNHTLDRDLPNIGGTNTIEYIVFPSGDINENGMANSEVTPYWDRNTLSFDLSTNITVKDTPFWNLNNIWSNNIIGLDIATAEEFYKYGSNDMLGLRSPFLCYLDTISPNDIQIQDVCVDASGNTTTLDNNNRAISVIHYTNNDLSNTYGDFFNITNDGKSIEVEIPNMMYHRRYFNGGTGTGDEIGMTFIADGSQSYTIKNSDIRYFDLIEKPELVNGDAKIVGKVLPDHHLIIFDNEEIVAALSYKSGRNWTLPELKLNLVNPTTGAGTGILSPNETMYVTYVLENDDNSIAYTLPCQKYSKILNESSGTKDVSFTINSMDELPYMRKVEGGDGIGFHASKFKVLFQIVEGDNRPKSNAWKEVDFTSDYLTVNNGETISPLRLENQVPETNNQKITSAINDTSSIYVINDKLNLPNNSEPGELQFGDERFFYGNIRGHIGANIYKTIFDIKISGNEFRYTSNPTRVLDDAVDAPEIRISEIGIYDNENDLVFITKLSQPIKLVNGKIITLEISKDF